LERVLEISGSGTLSLSVLDEMESKRSRKLKSRLSTDEVAGIFRQILDSGFLAERDEGGGFLPDSVVGSITVGDATSEVTHYFLADESQRQRQRVEIRPSVARVGQVLENLAGAVSAPKGTRRAARKRG
jgi:hypothetical protein